MSSNLYPEPPKVPKLSSAKELLQKIAAEQSAAHSPEKDGPIKSQNPQEDSAPADIETTSQAPLTEEDSNTEEDKNLNEVRREEEREGTTDAPDFAVEEGEATDDQEQDNFGPWEIVKHTGFVPILLWGVLAAAAAGAAAKFFAPGDWTWIAVAVLGFMTGAIAAIDQKTHLIKNQHVVLTAILTVPLALVAAFMIGPWNFLFGIISAVIVFGTFIFLVIKKNFGSGGDIKFSPIPAFVLGVVSPLAAVFWLLYSLVITVGFLLARKEKATSFGEGMAIAIPLALITVFGFYSLAGLPYMESATF